MDGSCPHSPQLSQRAAQGLCIPAAQAFSLPGQPTRARGLCQLVQAAGEGEREGCCAELGRAGGRWHPHSSWEPVESKTSIKPDIKLLLGLLLWQGTPGCLHCAFLTSHLSVLLLWNAGRECCLWWSLFTVSQLGTREQLGHHGHGATGQCQVPEHLLSALGASSSPGIVPGDQTWQPKTGTWGGGVRAREGLTVSPWWECVLPGLERS